MTLFGESSDDRRDRLLGIAGLTAGIHGLRILAERGLASSVDIQTSVDGVRAVLEMLPEGSLEQGQFDRLEKMFDQMISIARTRFEETE
ncbi:hypothetical protein P8R33_02790 [Qipengyuania sp. XHP0211]|uniref:hypothetical protein n=1 Tax=Qipengyuania sp. XHP0211 TaxID=3038079 RepID=UPI00241DD403|nr:hypothetical protein [Qipengyuania sp. XHP0211]MDG5750028.1 hypothetical protein [Qipengyuania sp. XHP0211]